MPTVNSANGTALIITNEGYAETKSVCITESLHANKVEKEVYSALVDVTTATTDDDFFYLKNNSAKDLVITKIEGWCADANQEIKVLVGATDAGTDAGDAIIPGNLTAGSGNVADVDCTQNATDLAISNGRVICLLKFPTTALEREDFHFEEGIILPKNQRLHLEAALAGLINLNIFFYFHD